MTSLEVEVLVMAGSTPLPPRARAWHGALALLVALLGGGAWAQPRAGQPLPQLTGDNLLGEAQTTTDLEADGPTLLVVLTDQRGADAMQAWFDAADTRAPAQVARKSILSLDLPFYVTEGLARGRAKRSVPREYWDDTLLDTGGQMAGALGLEKSPTPYVFAVGPDGKVLASVHAPVGAPGTETIWKALSRAPLPTTPQSPSPREESRAPRAAAPDAPPPPGAEPAPPR